MSREQEVLEKAKQKLLDYLEEKKLRKTTERFTILEKIYNDMGHFDAESLFITMKNDNFRVSRATVYNTLEILEDCDLVTRHQFGQNQASYEKSFGTRQHDHLICLDCGRTIEFCDPRIQSIQDMVGKQFGFEIEKHTLLLYGHCQNKDCASKNKDTAPQKAEANQ